MSSFDVAVALNFPDLPKYIRRVEQKLTAILPADNPYIDEPVARLLRAGGKRLRPSFALAIVASQGKIIDEKIIAGCAAIECVHLASLVHDDVLDDAESRHGTTTINHHAGLNRAIIVGDYLLARALEQAAIAGREIAQTIAAAFAAMCDGQARELADIGNPQRTQASYLQAIRGKSAALFTAACQIGGQCANLAEEQTAALASYGENFGMAYQILDDTLDFIAAPKAFGKLVGSDLREGNYTLPISIGFAGPDGKRLETLVRKSDTLATITSALIKDGGIEKTILEAKKYNELATRALEDFGDTTIRLSDFPAAYLNWTLENHTAPIYGSAVLKTLS